MSTAILNKFYPFSEALAEKVHNLGSDTFYIQLLNSPISASCAVEADLPADIGTGNGYTSGGFSAGSAVYSGQSNGVYVLKIANQTVTASGGVLGPFQQVVIYNQTSTNDNLIGWMDYGLPISLNNGENFYIQFDQTMGVLTLQ